MLTEYKRQSFHIIFCLVIISLTILLGREWTMLILLSLFFFLLFYSKINNFLPWLKKFLIKSFERDSDKNFYFKGAIYYIIGMLIALSFTSNLNYSIVLIGILGFSDGLATVIGIHDERKIFWNSKKSVFGTLAFITSAFIVSTIFLNLYQAIVLSVFLGFLETLPILFDDNILIPLAGIILLALI
ncbi:Uncharacterised protein [uncultured archaeon]|nr:Uncharacterised protein [uncultured archaeon]